MPLRRETKYKDVLESYRQAWDLSTSYVQGNFDLAIRLYKLWRGIMPTELDATYTKVNLNLAHAAVEERIPKHQEAIFSTRDFVSLEATSPYMEIYKDEAEMWLRDLLSNKINLRFSLHPTLLDVEVFGTGYRQPHVCYKNGKQYITSSPVDFFSVIPSPNGGLVNPVAFQDEHACDYIFQVVYMTEDEIKQNVKRVPFDKEETKAFLEAKPSTDNWTDTYRDQFSHVVGGVMYEGAEGYRKQQENIKVIPHRRRLVYWKLRDRLIVIGEDNYVLYDGKPLLGEGILDLVVYRTVRDGTNWFGISTLEMQEDIILAIMLNENLRLQHLIQAMFPIKWIRQDIMGSHPRNTFDVEPNAVMDFPDSVDDIRKALYYDRAQDVPMQAFQEDQSLQWWLQYVAGMPNYSKGMGGGGTLGNETATGITSLISQANSRFYMEAEQVEYGGLRDECQLLMLLGNKFVTEPTEIRVPGAQDGFGWTRITPEAITDGFAVRTHGTAFLTDKRQTIEKLMAWLPILLSQAQIVGPDGTREALRQGNEIIDVFPEPDKILPPATGAMVPQGMPPYSTGNVAMPQMGGMASGMDMIQRSRSTANRNTVEANTGRTVPAGFAA